MRRREFLGVISGAAAWPAEARGHARVSNCVVGSDGLRLPSDIVAKHGVEGCDHLSHDRNDDDFGFFIGGSERRLWKALRAGLYRHPLRAAM